MLDIVNYFSVFIYGVLITVFLLDIKMHKKNLIAISAFVIISIALQLMLYCFFGGQLLEKAYPLVVHLPLLIFCCIFLKKQLDSVLFVICTAYILTTPRRWAGDLIALAFNNNEDIAVICQIIASVALLFIIYKYLRPYVIKVLAYSSVKIRALAIVPLIYYIIAYLTTVYTQLLYSSRVVIIGIFGTGLALVFYYFLVIYFNEISKRFELQNEQNILAVQVSALEVRTNAIKQAEENAVIHRHDLRHHLLLISGYLCEGKTADAQNYIAQLEKSIDVAVVIKYCDNIAVNSILSSYINAAKGKNITVQSQVYIPSNCKIADIDLCIIFANAIENAINACENIKEASEREINISCKAKNDKLIIQVTNSFVEEVKFKDDMPVTSEPNHGFGTKSIAATVNKYQGVFAFSAESGVFKTNVIL